MYQKSSSPQNFVWLNPIVSSVSQFAGAVHFVEMKHWTIAIDGTQWCTLDQAEIYKWNTIHIKVISNSIMLYYKDYMRQNFLAFYVQSILIDWIVYTI